MTVTSIPHPSFTSKVSKPNQPNIGILYSPGGDVTANRYGYHVMHLVDKDWGYNAIPIDYNTLYKDAEMATSRHFKDKNPTAEIRRKKFLEILQRKTRNFLVGKHIDGIIFPGDVYNYDIEPKHPNEHRPLVSSVIFSTVLENEDKLDIPIMGICGGLQAYVNHAVGPQGIGRVKDMAHHQTHLAINHGASEPDQRLAPSYLDESMGYSGHVILPTKGSLLEEIAHEIQGPAPNGQQNRLMVPAAHGGACRNDDKTLSKLAQRNAKVAAHCKDNIVEAIEVRNDDGALKAFFIQGHPESAIFDHDGAKHNDEISRICERIMDRAIFDPAKEHMKARLERGTAQSLA